MLKAVQAKSTGPSDCRGSSKARKDANGWRDLERKGAAGTKAQNKGKGTTSMETVMCHTVI